MRKATAGLIVGLVIVGVVIGVVVTSDEAPIRVRNGSLNFFAEHGTNPGDNYDWKSEAGDSDENVPSYSHEPVSSNLEIGKTLYVRVVATGGCNMTLGQGKIVTVTYSDNTQFRMRRSRSGLINQRTKVRPKNVLQLDSSGAVLTYPTDGFVKKVELGNLTCTFSDKATLDTIFVCSSEKRCKPAQ